jgi:hypothetical protein
MAALGRLPRRRERMLKGGRLPAAPCAWIPGPAMARIASGEFIGHDHGGRGGWFVCEFVWLGDCYC